jgi:hypothetical protein
MHTRTPTDTLIAAMEEAEKATECLVIMTSNDGEIIWLSSNKSKMVKLGMLELVKQLIVAEIRDER